MYDLIIYLYLIGVAIASLFNKKVRTMWRGERQAISEIRRKIDPQAQYIWIHAASLGEFEQGRPIIEYLKKNHPEYKILLTFFSPSGYEVRKNYEGADIITYLPIDTRFNARRFLRTIRPVCALFIKYEFWYNYLHILKHRNIPVYSVSSIFRPNQIFFRWYGREYAKVLKCFTHFFVQNEQSRTLLREHLGITDVTVSGDTRLDRVLTIANEAKTLPHIEAFIGSREGEDDNIFVAGSSWAPDEAIFIPYFNGKNDWKLIIAPHVIDEDHLTAIERMLEANGRKPLRYTDLRDGKTTIEEYRSDLDGRGEAIIINCFGLLSSIYRYAKVTYVGGGFGVSIHNLPEAAVWSKPVIFGPNNRKFQEAQDLKICGGGLEIKDAFTFKTVMDCFISDPAYLGRCAAAAGEYIQHNAGAAKKVFDGIIARIKGE